jgi:hypothetical protein
MYQAATCNRDDPVMKKIKRSPPASPSYELSYGTPIWLYMCHVDKEVEFYPLPKKTTKCPISQFFFLLLFCESPII